VQQREEASYKEYLSPLLRRTDAPACRLSIPKGSGYTILTGMNRSERLTLLVLLGLLLLGLFAWRSCQKEKPAAVEPPPVVPSSATVPAPPVSEVKPVIKPTPKTSATATTPAGAPVAPKVVLHKELIPKNIEIVRCYYTAEVVPPGTTFGFDINGTGFTSEFQKMITVQSGVDHVRMKNLALVTANQIHGEIEVGAEAKTGFVFPRVLIKNLPVFSAPDPFAVVRKGEVLTVFFTSMQEDGRGGNFRVITNLDEDLASSFQIVPSTPGIHISDITSQLPYVMQGHMKISQGVPPGDHGLAISIKGKERFRRMGMIRIVRPTVGQMGFIQNLIVEDRYRRPGDVVQMYVQGTGLSIHDLPKLQGKVDGFDMGKGSFTYISPLQLRLTFQSPAATPIGSYGVNVLSDGGAVLFEKKNLFQIVPGNWVAGVQVSPPLKAGGKSQLKIVGRDFSEAFIQSFRIEMDEPGITLGPITRQSASAIIADISATAGTAPGDYWLHLSAQGKKIAPPFGSIIKIEAAQ
jgi:hypothetical protein